MKPTYPPIDELEPLMQESMFGAGSHNCDAWCIACGDWTGTGLEPDAGAIECPECEQRTMYGPEDLGIRGWYTG